MLALFSEPRWVLCEGIPISLGRSDKLNFIPSLYTSQTTTVVQAQIYKVRSFNLIPYHFRQLWQLPR